MSVSKKTTWELKIVHRFDFYGGEKKKNQLTRDSYTKNLKTVELAFFVQTMGRGLPTVGSWTTKISQYFRWKGLEMLEE